jgi:hypothetical protein
MLLPLLVVAIPLVGCIWQWRMRAIGPEERFPRTFLATMVFVPLAIHLVLGLTFPSSLRGVSGSPLWMFAGVLMLFCLKTRSRLGAMVRGQSPSTFDENGVVLLPSPSAWRKVWATWWLVVIGLAVYTTMSNVLSPYVLEKPSRTNFPGKALAASIDQVWKRRFARPLPIVAGDYFIAGSVAFYHPDRPRVYESTDEPTIADVNIHDCLWISDEEFRRQGGVIIWNAGANPDGLPREVLERFGVKESVELPPLPYQTGANVPRVRIGVALVPPEGQ